MRVARTHPPVRGRQWGPVRLGDHQPGIGPRGYPPIIIRRRDRDQYLDALGARTQGDLGAFVEIVAGRLEDSLRDLERSAQRKQGYDILKAKASPRAVEPLGRLERRCPSPFASIRSQLAERFSDSSVDIEIKEFDQLNVDDFIELCEGRPVRLSWAFLIRLRLPVCRLSSDLPGQARWVRFSMPDFPRSPAARSPSGRSPILPAIRLGRGSRGCLSGRRRNDDPQRPLACRA